MIFLNIFCFLRPTIGLYNVITFLRCNKKWNRNEGNCFNDSAFYLCFLSPTIKLYFIPIQDFYYRDTICGLRKVFAPFLGEDITQLATLPFHILRLASGDLRRETLFFVASPAGNRTWECRIASGATGNFSSCLVLHQTINMW